MRVLALGDSFVAGVGDPDCWGWFGRLVSAAGRRHIATTAYNLGVRRDTTGDVLARWEQETGVRRASGCDERLILSFGVNDCALDERGRCRVEPDRSVANLGRLLADGPAAGLHVLVVGPPPIADPAVNQRVRELNSHFRAVCRRVGTPFVDVFDALVVDEIWGAEVVAGDGAHPGAGGYERLAGLAMPTWLSWIGAC